MRPRITLLAAIALLALASPAIKWLVDNGARTEIAPPDAISFCNVLFVGNLCAGLLVVVVCGPRQLARDLAAADVRARWLLAATVLLAVAIPAMLFTAPPCPVVAAAPQAVAKAMTRATRAPVTPPRLGRCRLVCIRDPNGLKTHTLSRVVGDI